MTETYGYRKHSIVLLLQATQKMFEHMRKPTKKRADFIVVGPLTEESMIVTGREY